MNRNMIFESHAHYDDEAFDSDREELLTSLPEQGIGWVINVAAGLSSVTDTIELTRKWPFIYGALGIHPGETAELTEESFDWLRSQCAEQHTAGKCVAVGEIGLDYHWPEPGPSLQKKWFERQLELARELRLPVILHSREASRDTLDILRALHAEEIGGVIHCYSYSRETAREYLDMGFYFGIGGVLTFSNSKKLKEAAAYLPAERILLETDSPYLAPAPGRGLRNSSLNLPCIAQELARIKGMDYDAIVGITRENAIKLFSI